MPLIAVVLIGFLILTPFALGAMILTRNRKTRERLLSQAIREIRSPGEGESRLDGIILFAFFYAFMFIAMEIGIHI
jgi:hypothetical protein